MKFIYLSGGLSSSPSGNAEAREQNNKPSDTPEESTYVPPTDAERGKLLDEKVAPSQRLSSLVEDIKKGAKLNEEIVEGEKIPTRAEIKERLQGISVAHLLKLSPADLRVIFKDSEGNTDFYDYQEIANHPGIQKALESEPGEYNGSMSQEFLSKSLAGKDGKFELSAGSVFSPEMCGEGQSFGPLEFPTKADEQTVGLSDLMPPAVRKVEVEDVNGQKITAIRDGYAGNFYSVGKPRVYAKILNNYKFTILENDPEVAEKAKQDFEQSYGSFDDFLSASGTPDNETEVNGEKVKEKKLIYEMALRQGIDPHVLFALRKTENGGAGLEFGIKSVEAKDYINQLNMAARSIRNSMTRFRNQFPESEIYHDGQAPKLSLKFLAFFSTRYSPPGEGGVNVNHLPNMAKIYGKSRGIDFDFSNLNSLRDKMRQFSAPGMGPVGKPTNVEDFIASAKKYQGSPYVWGGEGRSGMDCSGLVIQALRDQNVISKNADTTASGLQGMVENVDRGAGKRGDLIFWKTPATHVAIITKNLGGGRYETFESASSMGGVGTRIVDTNKGAKTVGRLPFTYVA